MAGTVELSQMLEARERRAARQKELLGRYRLPLVSFTMNIAGPVKNSPSIRRGFLLGRRLLLGQLVRIKAAVVFSQEENGDTGCEGLYVVEADPHLLKAVAVEIEENTPLGRLFDMDVLTPDGEQLGREHPRRCLICGGPAKDCARSRTHSVAQLQRRTHALLEEALEAQDAEDAASLAVRALLYEVCVTPKPGLVDRDNNGSHQDMDIFTFMSSAPTLWPYFFQCVQTGRRTAALPAEETFSVLRWPGKLAEGEMLRATIGVNTHKGAIFSLGLVCGALGRLPRERWSEPEAVLGQVSAMTAGTVERELAALHPKGNIATAGERAYREHGVTGVRGQAQAGFPSVLEKGLPVLEAGLAAGRSFDEAGSAALLALLSAAEDTNMIARGGIEAQREASEQLQTLLENQPYPDRETVRRLDREYIGKGLSPGGSADLLAVCYLLHFLREEEIE